MFDFKTTTEDNFGSVFGRLVYGIIDFTTSQPHVVMDDVYDDECIEMSASSGKMSFDETSRVKNCRRSHRVVPFEKSVKVCHNEMEKVCETSCSNCPNFCQPNKQGRTNAIKHFLARRLTASVTRFDKISLLWQNCTSIWYFFHSLFLMWQNVETTLANLLHFWANFHRFKWPNNVNIWSHCSDSMKHTL